MYIEYASDYYKPRIGEIKEKIKTKSLYNRLVFLFREREKVSNHLHQIGDNNQTPVKRNIIDAYALDKVHLYMQEGKSDEDMQVIINTWKIKYEKYINNKKSPLQKYLKENEHVLPIELLETFSAEKTTDINLITKERLCGICYGMVLLREYIDVEIQEQIEGNSLSIETMNEIAEKYGSKIIWSGKLDSLGKLINMLFNSSLIEIEKGSSIEKSQLAYAHFSVKVQGTNRLASFASFKRPMLDTHSYAQGASKSFKKLLV